jgi:hypothetical protein
MIGKEREKKIYLFLFNDMLIFSKQQGGEREGTKILGIFANFFRKKERNNKVYFKDQHFAGWCHT